MGIGAVFEIIGCGMAISDQIQDRNNLQHKKHCQQNCRQPVLFPDRFADIQYFHVSYFSIGNPDGQGGFLWLNSPLTDFLSGGMVCG